MDTGKGLIAVYIALIALAVLMLAVPVFGASIVGSKHDFSESNQSGPTPFAGALDVQTAGFPLDITEICVFCHTPHGASKDFSLLWNRTNSPPAGYTYVMYSSSSLSSTPSSMPTGISMMCMSCHDGVTSVAVNTLLNGPGSGNPTIIATDIDPPGAIGNVYPMWSSDWGANLGGTFPGDTQSPRNTQINLADDHPVSFQWPTNVPGLKTQPSDTRLKLFSGITNNRIECATCHAVHDPQYEPFLAMPNTNSDMCRACHDK